MQGPGCRDKNKVFWDFAIFAGYARESLQVLQCFCPATVRRKGRLAMESHLPHFMRKEKEKFLIIYHYGIFLACI